jgi:restriction system protein
VVFNGRVSTIDKATGKPARPHLLSVSTDRATFADLVLASVEPAACLTRLNALVSPNPFDMEAVEPFIAFDLRRFRFTSDLDVVAGLDSRPNLLKLTPTEFEHLVRQLFVAMGAEAWATIPSKDGGVDAVATSKNLFFGGVCLIQAKRWTGVVGLESVHALTGVMADHNATTGVLVTTSWFGRASEEFAKRNRITLINGAELKQLIREHLSMDVIPGTSPPRRLHASDNLQTGRPEADQHRGVKSVVAGSAQAGVDEIGLRHAAGSCDRMSQAPRWCCRSGDAAVPRVLRPAARRPAGCSNISPIRH